MYYPESDILLRNNPEYELCIIKIDKLLGTMGPTNRKHLKLDIISDITGIKQEIIEFIFDYYCKVGILDIIRYISCPEESDFLDELNEENERIFPIKVFCDICGTEHIITEDNIGICYVLKRAQKTQPSINGINQHESTINANTDLISLKDVIISERTQDIVRIATVQLDYKLSETFPPKVIEQESIKEKLEIALKKTAKLEVDIVCFPELCFCEEWLKDIKSDYPNITIIPGTYYDSDNHNICKLLIDSTIDVPNQIKIKPSDFENPIVTGEGMISGDKIYIYETKFGKITILICRDFGNYIKLLSGKIDIAFVPAYNESTIRFEEIAQSHVSNYPSYIIISNASIFGGTSIFGQIDRAYFKRLEQAGCREKNSNSYKLCEIEKGKEGIIWADFNVVYKGIQKPTPIDPSEAKRSVINIRKLDLYE